MKNAKISIAISILLVVTFLFVLSGCDILNKFNNNEQQGDSLQNPPDTEQTNDKESACEHDFIDWYLYQGGSCENRIYKRICTKCQLFELRNGKPEDHNWESGLTVNPTCTSEGYDQLKCQICEAESKTNIQPTIDHSCVVEYNSTRHWEICTECHATFPEQPHEYDSDFHCVACNYFYDVSNPLMGEYEITLWVCQNDGVTDLLYQQIKSFMAENPSIIINATIEFVDEREMIGQIFINNDSSPDLFCFYQDKLTRLVEENLIARPSVNAQELISATNDKSSVASASVNGKVCAYPMELYNGCHMYYDTSIISPEDAKSLETLIAICEAKGKAFRYDLNNGFNVASFFFATGCHSNWTMDRNGMFTSVDDNFNSEAGLIAMKGMQKLLNSSCYDSNVDIFTNAGVLVTSTPNYEAAVEHFGNNLGVAELPSFTVDGNSYHLGSYNSTLLMGVKPTIDSKKATVLELLALYLSNEKCQLERFETLGWCPTNLNVQASPEVAENLVATAITNQNKYSRTQGLIHGSWSDIAKYLTIDAKAAKTDEDLQRALDDYEFAINAVLMMH